MDVLFYSLARAGGGGGTLIFYTYVGPSGPVSTVNPTSNKPCILFVVQRQTMQSRLDVFAYEISSSVKFSIKTKNTTEQPLKRKWTGLFDKNWKVNSG